MADDLKSVQRLEERMRGELEQSALFKQWMAVKTTLSLLANGHESNGTESAADADFKIPTEYSDDLTWREKVMFIIKKINGGLVSDILKELRKHGAKESDDFLNKRISTTASKLKTDGYLKGKKQGKQAKYFL